jgi:hypothetical protein
MPFELNIFFSVELFFYLFLTFFCFCRADELETALMEMVKQDNRRQLSAKVYSLSYCLQRKHSIMEISRI